MRLENFRGAGRSRASLPAAPTIVDFGNATVEGALAWFGGIGFDGRAAEIARDILPEIAGRLQFLRKVGLGYLQLRRGATTLSGGEAQRIRLAAQLGSNLSGVLYILDEPTIGLHAADNEKLLATLALLKARGNSLLVVEHDEETMRRADYIIDLGPGAGVNGGEVVACGPLRELMKHKDSVTARCLRARRSFPASGQRRPVDGAHAASVAARGRGQQFEEPDGRLSPGPVYLFDGRERIGQEHAAARLSAAGFAAVIATAQSAGGEVRARRDRGGRRRRCGRSMRWINPPLAGRRGRCPRPTRDFSMKSGGCSRKRRKRGCAAIRRAGFRSTARGGGARNASGRARSNWR